MMIMNATEYERFAQEIILQLSQASKMNGSDVQHNVKLKGVSGQKHQIDVYWEYERGGKKQRVAIECKNYKRRISLEKVCAFKGVLDDLDGVNGIMVTKVGFQKGAKVYAQKFGISLKVLRKPRYDETVIGELENHNHIEIRYTVFWIDEDWAGKNNMDIERYRERLSFMYPTRPEIWNDPPYIHLMTHDDIIRDSSGKTITTMKELESQIPDHPTDDFPYVFNFEDAFVEGSGGVPIKIRAVKYGYNIKDEYKTFALDAGDLVNAILKDAQSDKTDFIALRSPFV